MVTNLLAVFVWIFIVLMSYIGEFNWFGKKLGFIYRLIAFSVIAILFAIALKTMGWLGDIILRPFTWIF